MKKRTLVVAAAALLAPLGAEAGNGFYLGLEGGYNFGDTQDLRLYYIDGNGPIENGSTIATFKTDDGWMAGAVAGYAFANGLRPELAIDYRKNDVDDIHISPTGLLTGLLTPAGSDAEDERGNQNATSTMANLWLDLFKSSRIHPYLGGGVGAVRVAIDRAGFAGQDLKSDSDVVFGYQAGAGIGVDLTDRLTLSFDYRYLRTDRARLNLIDDAPETRVRVRYEAETAMLGLRYSFGETPAPAAEPVAEPAVAVVPAEPVVEPAPAPAPPPPCESLQPGQPFSLAGCDVGQTIVLHGVKFEFDKTRLTVNARTLLDQVADALLARPDIQVQIAGHTDAKGSDAYNQKLSERRAVAVKDYLGARGVDAARMSTVGFGESQPVADNATDDGRELNRRVELSVTGSNPGAGPQPTVAPVVPGGDAVPAATAAPAAASEATPEASP